MKFYIISFYLLLFQIAAFAEFPKLIIAGTEEVASSKFAIWKESNPTAYTGRYEGDTAGDTIGKLEIKIKKSGEKFIPYTADGTYRQQTAGMNPTIISFSNGSFMNDNRPVIWAGPIEIYFVIYGGHKGIIIGENFISKQ